jgi:hypothetical protein
VQLADVREMARSHEARESILAKLAADLTLLSEALTRAYFSHAVQSRQLATS